MCDHCVVIAQREFERWPDAQQKTARAALFSVGSYHDITARGDNGRYARGREIQRSMDDERYQKVVAPKVHAIRAAVAAAEEQIAEGRELSEILRLFLTNVRTDSAEIPLVLPV